MKAGFKPKDFTKSEWQKNRLRKCNGSGVGKALDAFQKKCSFNLRDLDRKGALEAMKTVNQLKAALEVAKKKCSKDDVNMIKGIDAYHAGLDRYKKALALTNVALNNRVKYHAGLNLNAVLADATALKYMIANSKKALYSDELTAFLLGKKKKLAEAVRKYGKNNLYNIPGDLNAALKKIYIEGVKQTDLAGDKKLKKFAKKDLASLFNTSMIRMMNGSVSSFKDSDDFKKLLDVKYPILNFSM